MTISDFLRTQSRGRTGTILLSLVFETNASTDSAIWALRYCVSGCKYTRFLAISKKFCTSILKLQEKIVCATVLARTQSSVSTHYSRVFVQHRLRSP